MTCEAKVQEMYVRKEQSSANIQLDVGNLKHPHNSSRGWLSQENEDRWLYEHFFHDAVFSGPGTFLELGALDGIRFSNTYLFEKALQWTGVLIEASTINFESLERNRGQGTAVVTLHAAVCEPGKTLELYGSGSMAGVAVNNGNQQVSRVTCIQLDNFLLTSGIHKLDLLSLDVEGMELEVLKQMNFQAVQTFVVLIEMRPVDESTNPLIREYLSKQGFCLFASNVGHSNEVWINPQYEHNTVRQQKRTELMCEDFLGMASDLWQQLPQQSAEDSLRCDVHLGQRPASHIPFMGTTCQPWLTKCSIEALARIMRPTMHGLEWSCGSGTLWYLQRLASLTSIERDLSNFQMCQEKVALLGVGSSQKWTGYHVGVNNSFSDRLLKFQEYVNKPSLLRRKRYDFIVVDGRERVACIDLIFKHSLLRSEDGILVLDNSERPSYVSAFESVPSHWLRYDFKTKVDTTTIWISRLKH